MTDPNDDMLDDIFAQARSVAPVPSDTLIARVLADAVPPVPTRTRQVRRGLLARLLEVIGGWPAMGGLATATVAGIWVGVAPPASVADLMATLIGDEISVSLFSTDLVLETGGLIDG